MYRTLLGLFSTVAFGSTMYAIDSVPQTTMIQMIESANNGGPMVCNADGLVSGSSIATGSVLSIHDIERGVSHNGSSDTIVSRASKPSSSWTEIGDFWTFLRLMVFTTYRQLLAIICIANLIALVLFLARTHHPLTHMATAFVANLTISILIRQDYVRNILFHICWSSPLWIRKKLALVYENGGVHSGGAICAVAWFVVFVAFLTKKSLNGSFQDRAVLTLVYALLSILLSILVGSIPQVRRRHHSLFENTHRLGGWAAILLFWPTLVLFARASAQNAPHAPPPLGVTLAKSPAFWLLLILSAHIIYPWLSLRKVSVVKVENLSPNAIRIYFSPTEKITPLHGLTISDSPLHEWHSFAAIPDIDGTDSGASSCIVARAGDWTAKTIELPAEFYWLRGVHMAGTLAMAKVFRSVVIMATGSGVGPCMYLLGSCPDTNVRIIWSAPSPEASFGEKIYRRVMEQDPRAVIVDTRKEGQRRPDLVALAAEVYRESGAEAVFFISNRVLIRRVVKGLKGRGIPTFAPVFDS